MSPEEIKKLLGGYATGTLTAEEQQALFAAALEDQELFDTLAREQTLRDLLSDPASRAHLLTAMETPARRTFGFWAWLRRPAVAGLAVAGVGGIAILAVLLSTQGPHRNAAAPQIVAELRLERAPAQSTAEVPAPSTQQADKKSNAPKIPPTLIPDRSVPLPTAPPPAGMPAEALRKPEAPAVSEEKKEAAPPVPAPAMMARKAETQAVTVEPSAGMSAGALSAITSGNLTLDARALFYAGPLVPAANSFAAPSGGGGAAPPPPRAPAPQADAVARFSAAKSVAAPRFGVRISVQRAAGEADLTTVLDPGEKVSLQVIPNADGYLYVVEGGFLIAGGTVQRLKPFGTTPLRFQGSGQDQLYVVFSKRFLSVDPRSLGSLAPENLVRTSSEQDRATYVVSGVGEQQIVVPVTLTYR
jgi:hypothetical protein